MYPSFKNLYHKISLKCKVDLILKAHEPLKNVQCTIYVLKTLYFSSRRLRDITEWVYHRVR